MKTNSITTEERNSFLAWAGIAAFLVILTGLFPLTGDDWYGLASVRDQGRDMILRMSIPDFLRSNTTGRAAASMLGLFFFTSRWTSILYRVLLFLGLLYGMWKLSELSRYRVFGLAVAFIISFAVPKVLFRQCYSWYSGLVNYLPPSVLLLLYLLILKPLFSGKAIQDTWWKIVACLLLGFVLQFFVETITIYCVYMSIAVVIWHLARTKKVSWTTVAFCAAAILGCILMFSRPEYQSIATTGSTGHTAPNSLGMLLQAFKSNYPAFSNYLIKDHMLLHVLLSGCSLFLLYRGKTPEQANGKRNRNVKTVVSIVLVLVPLYFFLSANSFDEETRICGVLLAMIETFDSFYVGVFLDALLCGLYCLSILYVMLRCVPKGYTRNLGVFCILSALLVCAPMCILQPAAYRCFLMTYLFWALSALLLLVFVLDTLKNSGALMKAVAPFCYAVAAGLCAFYLILFGRCQTIDHARSAYTEAQMEQKAMSIVLPQYGCADYLHLPDDALEVYYYYDKPLEIQFSYIPYDQWLRQYGNGNG